MFKYLRIQVLPIQCFKFCFGNPALAYAYKAFRNWSDLFGCETLSLESLCNFLYKKVSKKMFSNKWR